MPRYHINGINHAILHNYQLYRQLFTKNHISHQHNIYRDMTSQELQVYRSLAQIHQNKRRSYHITQLNTIETYSSNILYEIQ